MSAGVDGIEVAEALAADLLNLPDAPVLKGKASKAGGQLRRLAPSCRAERWLEGAVTRRDVNAGGFEPPALRQGPARAARRQALKA